MEEEKNSGKQTTKWSNNAKQITEENQDGEWTNYSMIDNYWMCVRVLTLGVPVTAGADGMAQLWLEQDLLGDAPLDDGRDLRPL